MGNNRSVGTRPHPDWTRGAVNGAAVMVILFVVVMAGCFIADTMPRFASLADALGLSPWRQIGNWLVAGAVAVVGGGATLFLVAMRPAGPPDQPMLSKAFRRSLIYLTLAFGVLMWDLGRRSWAPERELETEHYRIQSSASEGDTKTVGDAVESLNAAYGEYFADRIPADAKPGLLRMKLYRDRGEFRFVNRINGWAEAFYLKPFCHAYYDGGQANPYHWMLHEATHQLNWEVAGFKLKKWLEEGIACYFGASQLRGENLLPGVVNEEAYPVWWLLDADFSGRIDSDIAGGAIIPLRDIVTGKGGPDMDRAFNTYYVHWWTLVHFLFDFDNQKYRAATMDLISEGGSLAGFERHIGKLDKIQREWYGYLIFLQGRDLQKLQDQQ
jgi:hypothetical protein